MKNKILPNISYAVIYIGCPMIAHQLTKFIAWLFKAEYNHFVWYVLWVVLYGCSFMGLVELNNSNKK